MLHAEIHGKLSSEASELERAEDVLTSTVFGTLLLADGAEVLAAWLGCATNSRGQSLQLDSRNPNWWFWPRLAKAEPDVVLRFAEILVVVEAKFLSAKSGTKVVSTDGMQGSREDQLARQWRSVQKEAFPHTPHDLRGALEQSERRCIVYLVRGRDTGRARRELEKSIAMIELKSASDDMFLLTWDRLHGVLAKRIRSGQSAAWERDLRALLERRGLRGFVGFAHALDKIDWDCRASAYLRCRRLREPIWEPRFTAKIRNCCNAVIPKRLANAVSDIREPGEA